MALIDTSITDFVKTINRETLVPLAQTDLILSPVYPDVEDVRVTQLRLTTRSGYQYRGSEILTYDRLDLAYLAVLLHTRPCLYPKEDTLYQILPEVTDGLGIRLEEEDVFDADVVEEGGGFVVTLKAKPGSYRWFGEYILRFNDLPRLSSVVENDYLTW